MTKTIIIKYILYALDCFNSRYIVFKVLIFFYTFLLLDLKSYCKIKNKNESKVSFLNFFFSKYIFPKSYNYILEKIQILNIYSRIEEKKKKYPKKRIKRALFISINYFNYNRDI